MLEENYKFLINEYKKEKEKHQYHIHEANKCLKNMLDIQTEIMNLENEDGDGPLR